MIGASKLKTLPAATILNTPNPTPAHNTCRVNQWEIMASADINIEWSLSPTNINEALAAWAHKLDRILTYTKPAGLVVSAMPDLVSRSSPLIYLSIATLWLICS